MACVLKYSVLEYICNLFSWFSPSLNLTNLLHLSYQCFFFLKQLFWKFKILCHFLTLFVCRMTYLSLCMKKIWTGLQEFCFRSMTQTHTCSTWLERSYNTHIRLPRNLCTLDSLHHIQYIVWGQSHIVLPVCCLNTLVLTVSDKIRAKYFDQHYREPTFRSLGAPEWCNAFVCSRVTGTSGATSWALRNLTSAFWQNTGPCCHRKDSVRSTMVFVYVKT